MSGVVRRRLPLGVVLALGCAAVVAGCKGGERPTPLPDGALPDNVRDVGGTPLATKSDVARLQHWADQVRNHKQQKAVEARMPAAEYKSYLAEKGKADDVRRRGGQAEPPKPPLPGDRLNILCLSGGSADGAYQAGVLCGWTARGDRPAFDVVTGVSTGALVAAMSFPGPGYDPVLRREFTTVQTEDIFTLRTKPVWRAFTIPKAAAVGDSSPLEGRIRTLATPEYLACVAAEHARGRRLYIGTTNLDTKRPVVWDMGAIAARGDADSRELYVSVLLASASIPGFFPPVRMPVVIDGQPVEELHVDGGTTRRFFYRPPMRGCGPDEAPVPAADMPGAHVYVIVAGKLFGNPEGTRHRLMPVAFRALDARLEADARNLMFRLYTTTALQGMYFHQTAVPEDFDDDAGLTDFDRPTMNREFCVGFENGRNYQWEDTPPEPSPATDLVARRGRELTATPLPPLGPTTDDPLDFCIDPLAQPATPPTPRKVPQTPALPRVGPRVSPFR